jgi:hypothetical protein
VKKAFTRRDECPGDVCHEGEHDQGDQGRSPPGVAGDSPLPVRRELFDPKRYGI